MIALSGRARELSVGDHNNDALGIAAMLGMFFGMLLLFGIVGFCVRRAYNRRKQAIELRAPLLECVRPRSQCRVWRRS
jgi:nitrate reductase gamma subunit